MPNRPTIDVYERKNLRTNGIDYAVHIYDDYAHTTLIFAEKSEISDDDMTLLQAIIKAKHQKDFHGTSCDIVENMLDYIEEHEVGICIGGTFYDWDEIKETMGYDYRRVYECPKCGWTSWDDDCYDCGQTDCDGKMQYVNEELYQK